MLKEMTQAKIIGMNEASYEDGRVWISYEDLNGNLGCDLVPGATAKDYKVGQTISVYDKLTIDVCSSLMAHLVHECASSSNDILFIESEDMRMEEVNAIMKEADELDAKYPDLKIKDHILFFKDDCPITVEGGIQTLFKY